MGVADMPVNVRPSDVCVVLSFSLKKTTSLFLSPSLALRLSDHSAIHLFRDIVNEQDDDSIDPELFCTVMQRSHLDRPEHLNQVKHRHTHSVSLNALPPLSLLYDHGARTPESGRPLLALFSCGVVLA